MDPNAGHWAHCLRYAVKSDVGLRRANNQDSLNVALASGQQAWEERGHLFLVADGMGAHAAGELASKIAADVVPLTYQKLANLSPPEAPGQRHLGRQQADSHPRPGEPRVQGHGHDVQRAGDLAGRRGRGPRRRQPRLSRAAQPDRSTHLRPQPRLGDAPQRPDWPTSVVKNLVSKNIITRSLGPDAGRQARP